MLTEITPALATIAAAIVGGLVGLLSSRLQVRAELRRWPREREDAIAASLREAIHDYATTLATASHSMCWLTWAATQGGEYLNGKRVTAYNDKIHGVLPRIAGSLASIAALDGSAYEGLAPIAEELYELDAKIGEAVFVYEKDGERAVNTLAELHGRVAPFERSVPRRIAGVVSRIVEARAESLLNRDRIV